MGYLAIARQWRPTKFDDLVGQGHVVQTLKNAIQFNRVSHAYLFSGARGVGKTSVARIFAKALRCPNVQNAIPCNECPECQAIAESRSVDVVEIDGASNNGVEAVRGIRENVAYGASSGNYKIYIIDEVHMLSVSAFNALLKTLEEPPAHVIFIFATTEVQKIPLTILSRCQRFEFRRLTNSQIVERLKFILAAEHMTLTEEALQSMASHSDGSLRDALSLLDQVLSYYGEKKAEGSPLDEKQVVEALGINESSSVRELFHRILSQDLAGLIKLIGDTYLSGVDLKHFAERCLEELRLLYLMALAKESKTQLTAETLDISGIHYNELIEMTKQGQATVLPLERMSQILSHAIHQLSWSSSPRYVLEMAAIRMAKLDGLSQLEAALSQKEPAVSATAIAAPSVTVEIEETELEAVALPPEPPQDLEMQELEPPGDRVAPHSVPRPEGAKSDNTWRAFVDTVMKKRPLLGALLSHANFKVEAGERGRIVHLAFPAGSFYERQATDNKLRMEIDDMLKAYFGPGAELKLDSDVEGKTKSLEETRRIEEEAAKKTALGHPMVRQMKEMLGAEVVDVNVEI